MTPEEIAAALEVFNLLEPEVQKGIVALIHLFRAKQTGQAMAESKYQEALAAAKAASQGGQ